MSSRRHEPVQWHPVGRSARWYEWLLILLLLGLVGGVRAESIYKCTGADGGVAYQAEPCATQQASVVRIAPAPPFAKSPEYAVDPAPPPRERIARSSRRESEPTSFECRSADGQLFYRHSGCPHSVAADASSSGSSAHRGGRGSGASVAVTASRITRDEACRRIHASGAIGRSGHQHDDDVSTYDRDLGRDPCR